MSLFSTIMLAPLAHWGILLAGTLVFFVLGWLWYSPITAIGKKWATYFPNAKDTKPSGTDFVWMLLLQLFMGLSYTWITMLLWMIANSILQLSALFATAFVLKVYGGFVFIKDLGHWYYEKRPLGLTLIGLGYYLVGIVIVCGLCGYFL